MEFEGKLSSTLSFQVTTGGGSVIRPDTLQVEFPTTLRIENAVTELPPNGVITINIADVGMVSVDFFRVEVFTAAAKLHVSLDSIDHFVVSGPSNVVAKGRGFIAGTCQFSTMVLTNPSDTAPLRIGYGIYQKKAP